MHADKHDVEINSILHFQYPIDVICKMKAILSHLKIREKLKLPYSWIFSSLKNIYCRFSSLGSVIRKYSETFCTLPADLTMLNWAWKNWEEKSKYIKLTHITFFSGLVGNIMKQFPLIQPLKTASVLKKSTRSTEPLQKMLYGEAEIAVFVEI